MKTKQVLEAEAFQQSSINPTVHIPEMDEWFDPQDPCQIPAILCCCDYVAIAPFAPAIRSAGGIVLPGAQQSQPNYRPGLVVAAGPDAKDKVHVGSVVLYSTKPMVADLTGLMPGFNKKLDLVRPQNLLCVLALPQSDKQE